MKQRRYRFRLIALLLTLSLLGLILWGSWSVRQYSNRWFSYGSNVRLINQKRKVTAGDILDRNGIILATTADGSRVYRETAADRAALVHLLGDREGRIANGVERFQAGYLYGYRSSLLDAVHHLIRKTDRVGNTVTLTVDADLCTEAHNAFARHGATAGHAGAAVVMNYRTGEVLAFVSLPDFDPDNASAEIIGSLNQPYWNRVTQALLPPGSTFKIVTAAAMLENLPGIDARTFSCDGLLQVTDRFSVRDYQHAVHGNLSLREAFLHSCNVVFATGALEVGNDALRNTARRFGFNDSFLFRDLVVEDSSYPAGNQEPSALAASGYGQSAVSATPLHLCLIAGAIANDGIMQEPRLLKSGAPVLSWSSAVVRTVCGTEVAHQLQSMMKGVVQGGGSGSRAAVSSLDIRGKTGTSESTDGGRVVNYGWFVGYNAQDDLPFSLCILVEDIAEGDTGGTTAALIAKDLFSYMKKHPEKVR